MTERRALRAVGGLGLLMVALAAVKAAGSGRLATPPLSSRTSFLDWVDDQGPATVAMSLVRLAAEGVLWYLVAMAVVVVIAEVTRWSAALRLADLVAAPVPDRVVRVALGITLATTGQPLSLAGGDLSVPSRGSVTMVALGDDDAAAGVPSMERLAPGDDVATGGPAQTVGTGTARAEPWPDGRSRSAPGSLREHPVAAPIAATPAATWTVEPGESFWAIATETMADRLGQEPSDADVVPYWLSLIDTNRDRLVDPDNPDLILPGQVFELP